MSLTGPRVISGRRKLLKATLIGVSGQFQRVRHQGAGAAGLLLTATASARRQARASGLALLSLFASGGSEAPTKSGAGSALLSLTAAGGALARKIGAGSAALLTAASGSAITRRQAAGAAAVALMATGTARAQMMAGGSANLATTAAGAATVTPFPTFAPAFFRMAADAGANTVEQTDQTFVTSDVDTANSKIAIAGLSYSAFGSFTAAYATRVFFSSTGTLPAPLQANTPYYLSPAAGGGWDIYPEAVASDNATTPTMLPEDTPMPAQNFAQLVNKVVLTSQGSGTHRIRSMPLVKELANLISGKPAYKVQDTTTNRHQRFEVVTDGRGDKALLSRILARSPADAGAYNLYGFAMDIGPSDQRNAFQLETRSKRTVVQFAVLDWRESDTRGISKCPILPAGVNTTTGVLTYSNGGSNAGFATGDRVRLIPHLNGGVLPAGFSGGAQDYYVRVSSNTQTLHPTSADATANTNAIIPTTQGSVGFIIYAPERPGDVERMRFIAEHREPIGGQNVHTVRTNITGFLGATQIVGTDFVVSGTNNGRVGFTGRTIVTTAVPTNADIARVRVWFPIASLAPTRSDTGQPLASGSYWARREPNSSAYYLLYDSQVACQADIDAVRSTATSSCIKYSAVGTGYCRVEKDGTGPMNVGVERSGGDTWVSPRSWTIPLAQKGLLTTIADYDDPTATGIRVRYLWNGVEVVNLDTGLAKGVTGSGTNTGSNFTALNSPGRHVPMEGFLYDLTVAASAGELTNADLKPVNDWLMAKYGIAA